MKNNSQIPKNCVLIISFILLAIGLAPAKEPVYNGKALSEWLVELQGDLSEEEIVAADRQHIDTAKLAEQKQKRAEEAIRQIGTNAIPTLVDLLGVTDENRWLVLRKLKSRELRKGIHAESAFNSVLSELALKGFGILGTNAEPAIPQIVKLFNNVKTCVAAAQTLALLGPDGLAALTNGLSNKNDDIRGVTVRTIGERSPLDSNTIARIMVESLKDSHPWTRADAARYLAGKDPATAIPALLPMLNEDDAYVVANAARSLGSYGSSAKAAIPKLFMLYTNAAVQRDKTKIDTIQLMPALKAIDLEAAKQAEEFLVNSGPLNEARRGYSRTKLPNGMELIAGGVIDAEIIAMTNHFLASAQLLDPKTGRWTETGKMNAARFDHKATLLSNGKVLVEGGHGEPSIPGRFPPPLSSAELYDPNTGTWTVVTNK